MRIVRWLNNVSELFIKAEHIDGSRQEVNSCARSILNAIAATTRFITMYLHIHTVDEIVTDRQVAASAI